MSDLIKQLKEQLDEAKDKILRLQQNMNQQVAAAEQILAEYNKLKLENAKLKEENQDLNAIINSRMVSERLYHD